MTVGPVGHTPNATSRMKSKPANGDGSRSLEPVEGTARRVPIEGIRVDSTYQRDAEATRIHRLVRDWDPQLAGALILSSRAGSLWCVEGQHRLLAMKELGIHFCNAVVYAGLGQKDEADLFVKHNRNRKGLTAWDLFKGELVAEHEEATTLVRIVNALGFHIDRNPGHLHIQAVGAIRRIFGLGGEPLLTVTLQSVRRNWNGDKNALAGQVVEGLAIFYHSFRAEPQYDDKRTDAILDNTSPSTFQRRAQEIAAERTANGISAANLAEAIRNTYNERLGPSKRLGSIRKVRRAGWVRATA